MSSYYSWDPFPYKEVTDTNILYNMYVCIVESFYQDVTEIRTPSYTQDTSSCPKYSPELTTPPIQGGGGGGGNYHLSQL